MVNISVTFKNNTVFNETWTIKDGMTDNVLFDGPLSAKDEPGDRVTLSLATGTTGRWGEARYKHSGQSIFTHVDFLEDGATVDMN